MSVYEPNSRHLREVLIFSSIWRNRGWGSSNALKYLCWTFTLSERMCREWFQRLKNGDFDVEDQRWKREGFEDAELEALLEQDSCQNQEELARSLGVTQLISFQNVSKPWGKWFRNKEIGCRTNWSREMLNGICLLVNSCLKSKEGRDFCIALWLGTKNGFIMIIPSAENHGKFPAMLPRRRPNRIFTAPRSCSVFGGTSSA